MTLQHCNISKVPQPREYNDVFAVVAGSRLSTVSVHNQSINFVKLKAQAITHDTGYICVPYNNIALHGR